MMDGAITTNFIGLLVLMAGFGLIALAIFLPRMKAKQAEKEEKEELDSAMKDIYALADGDDYLVRRALRETADADTGKSTVEDVKLWLEKRKENLD